MYIAELVMKNFRCFSGKTILKFSEGLNFFVGDNNCGKTTIFRAIDFLLSAKNTEEWISKDAEDDEVSVEILLRGNDFNVILEKEELKKYKDYCVNGEEGSEIRIRRSSQISYWTDSKGRKKEIGIKNIAVWNPENRLYENPTGADTMISALFDAQFVFSDLNNEEYRDFSKTKIVGKLINEVTRSFQQTDAWKQLQSSHEAAFGEKGLATDLYALQTSIEEIMKDQYGDVKVEFSFGLPTIDSFFKTGQILLEDNGIKTDVSEKGTGMQRALAMSLIQVYASISNSESNTRKPIFFFLDEPETFLHPRAQDKLLDSLDKLSTNTQVFVTTHSPYLLKNYKNKDSLKIFRREQGIPRVEDGQRMNLFSYSPTWSEINYFAFGVVSEEFHIELYGLLHNKLKKLRPNEVKDSIGSFDNWLKQQKEIQPIPQGYVNKNDKTLTTYIRNWIDHPGNNDSNSRPKPEREEIRTSIKGMLKIIDRLNSDL